MRQLTSFQLTRRGDESNLGADGSLPPLAERPHLDDVSAPLRQRERGRGVNGSRHLVVASALLLQ